MQLGTGEIVIVLSIFVLIFGSSKLKELAKGTGEASRELKKARKDITQALIDPVETDEPAVQEIVAPIVVAPKVKRKVKKAKKKTAQIKVKSVVKKKTRA